MGTVGLILMVAAFILFVLATIGVVSPPKFNLMAAGLACWVLATLLVGIPALR